MWFQAFIPELTESAVPYRECQRFSNSLSKLSGTAAFESSLLFLKQGSPLQVQQTRKYIWKVWGRLYDIQIKHKGQVT